ncbi:MAG TPA: peptidylprolyl isomerase [Mycobacteriales bacterium]|nr:peptidylprolyl isomerase [Mycobacteriales bacterium]
MTSNKRQRELARLRAERQAARRRQRAAARRKRMLAIGGVFSLVLLVLLGVLLVPKLVGDDDPNSVDPLAGASADPSGSADPSASAAPAKPGECAYTKSGDAGAKSPGLPPAKPSVAGAEKATITLNSGAVQVDLLPAKAPCTVGSFAFLAGKKFFDGTPCHRVTTGAGLTVVQCGDPTGTGSGGPGYSFPDENLEGATYKRGTVAMANSGPDTNGSQFFLVVKDSQLPPSYIPFGTITGGLEVLDAIIAAGVEGGGTDGKPAKPVTIQSFTVSK